MTAYLSVPSRSALVPKDTTLYYFALLKSRIAKHSTSVASRSGMRRAGSRGLFAPYLM